MPSLPNIKLPSPGRVYLPKLHGPSTKSRVKWRFVNKGHRIKNAMAVWERTFLSRSGASIRTYALRSMKRRKNKDIHSPVGSPPFSHLKKSEFLRQAILWALRTSGNTKSVLVGAYKPKAGFWGQKHEYGGFFGKDPKTGKKALFVPRPFMRPAFNRWLKFGLPTILKDTGIRAYGLR